ncbi:MAG: PAS domain S-box protein [Candidatus Bathyarchaeia archaeon]
MAENKELAHFLELLHALFDGLEEHFYVVDPQTYEILFANDGFKRFFGEDVEGKKCYEVIHGKSTPCSFCVKELVFGENLGKIHVLDRNYPEKGLWYKCIHKAAKWPGNKFVKFGLAVNVTRYKEMERALAESERRYRTLVETAPDVIYTLSSDGKIISLNPAFEKITGWKREEWIGKPFVEIIHPDDVAKAVESFRRILAGKLEIEPLELRVHAKSGEYLVGEFVSVPLIVNGEIVGELGIARDVTSRKMYEEELQRVNRTLRTLIQAIPDIVYFKDSERRNLIVNNAYEKFVGLKADEIVGKKDEEILPSELAEQCRKSDEIVLRNGVSLRAEECTVNEKGEKRYFETIKVPVLDKSGKVVGLIGVSRDITERKLMEEKLREREEFFRSVVENSHDGIAIIDKNFRIIYANDVLTEILGYSSKDEIVGQDFRKFLADKGKALFATEKMCEEAERYKRKVHPSTYELKIVRKDGAQRIIEVKATTLWDSHGRMRTITQVLDVTQRRKLEEERKLFEKRLSELNKCAQKLNKARNLREIYRITLDALEKTLGFEYASLFVVDGDFLRLVAQRGYSKVSSLELPLTGEKGITVRAARTGKTIYVPDIRKNDAYVLGGENILSELAVPMKAGKKVLGVLNVESSKLAAFSENDKELLEILASHVATAISNIKRQENLEFLSKNLGRLIRIMQIEDAHERLRAIAKTIQKFGWRKITISLRDENLERKGIISVGFTRKEVVDIIKKVMPAAFWREIFSPKFEEHKVGEFYHLSWDDQKLLEELASKFQDLVKILISHHPSGLLAAPLRTPEGKIVGILTLDAPTAGVTPSRENLALIELFLPYAALTLENLMLIENLAKAKKELKQYADQLEQKVEERTRELKEMHDKLLKAQRMAVIGELAGMVGHDLRNPLTSIAGAAYYLKRRLSQLGDEKVIEMLDLIERNIAYSNKIVNDLLDFSRDVKLDITETNPEEVVNGALAAVQIPSNIEVVKLVDKKPKIRADFEKLKRIFVNLIRNAVEAMPKGGTLTIKSVKKGDSVEFTVSDTGIGMTEEVMKKLWTPLFTTKAKGMGLGLAICKRFVEAHGGTITVESAPGKGATFTVTLPLEPKIEEEGGEKIWIKMLESSLLTTTKT